MGRAKGFNNWLWNCKMNFETMERVRGCNTWEGNTILTEQPHLRIHTQVLVVFTLIILVSIDNRLASYRFAEMESLNTKIDRHVVIRERERERIIIYCWWNPTIIAEKAVVEKYPCKKMRLLFFCKTRVWTGNDGWFADWSKHFSHVLDLFHSNSIPNLPENSI